mgnify:CR=1 FL=1
MDKAAGVEAIDIKSLEAKIKDLARRFNTGEIKTTQEYLRLAGDMPAKIKKYYADLNKDLNVGGEEDI